MGDKRCQGVIVLISGKRFSGKDTFAAMLSDLLSEGDECCVRVLRIADEFKKIFAKNNNLDHELLINNREYKEQHREQMVIQFNKILEENDQIFINEIINNIDSDFYKDIKKKMIWIVSDLRHLFEVDAIRKYRDSYPYTIKCIILRINTLNEIRRERGWNYIEEVDNDRCEVNLDKFKGWDMRFNNSYGLEEMKNYLQSQLIPTIKFLLFVSK